MKAKAHKVYTLAQVKKLLRKGNTTIYKYVEAGLIKVSPDKVAMKSGERPVMVVSEAEFERLKRDGVDTAGMIGKTGKRKASGKPPKRSTTAAVATAKKRIKRKAAAATAKKQVKRSTVPRKTTGVRRKK